MSYKSDHPKVEKALNSISKKLVFAFILCSIGSVLFVAYLTTRIEDPAFPLFGILFSLVFSYVFSMGIGLILFNKKLNQVECKAEFVERLKRTYWLSASSIDFILKEKGITELKRVHPTPILLPEIQLEKSVVLNNRTVIINGNSYEWRKIKSFRISISGHHLPQLYLYIHYENTIETEEIQPSIKSNLEYEMDKYWNNAKLSRATTNNNI